MFLCGFHQEFHFVEELFQPVSELLHWPEQYLKFEHMGNVIHSQHADGTTRTTLIPGESVWVVPLFMLDDEEKSKRVTQH